MPSSDPTPSVAPLYLPTATLPHSPAYPEAPRLAAGIRRHPARADPHPGTRSSRWRRHEIIAAIESWGTNQH